jgi:hypothetical protein
MDRKRAVILHSVRPGGRAVIDSHAPSRRILPTVRPIRVRGNPDSTPCRIWFDGVGTSRSLVERLVTSPDTPRGITAAVRGLAADEVSDCPARDKPLSEPRDRFVIAAQRYGER